MPISRPTYPPPPLLTDIPTHLNVQGGLVGRQIDGGRVRRGGEGSLLDGPNVEGVGQVLCRVPLVFVPAVLRLGQVLAL